MTDEFREEIVIVGMAGRFPGAASVAEFWANLRDGVESIRSLSADELAAAGVDPGLAASDGYVPATAPLEHADAFDAAFFGYTPRDAQIMDPQHRVFLECAWSALEDAGYDPATCPGPVGLFGGVGPNTYRQQVLETRQDILGSTGRYPLLIGSEREYAISRAAFKLGLTGPVVAVATACSTSGVALHLACQSVLSGECDMALAGGARVSVPLGTGYVYEQDGILSPDGHCRAFDADARGTVVGSGVAMVVIKRLSDALRDGDAIRAVIKGTAINNDGADKIGFTAPGVSGQETVIRQALEMADVDAASIGYVEAHGTGTFLGDPIEVEALTRAYRADTDAIGYCGIGSVKTNIGHLDAGAGMAGVIKAVLALESGEIPPSLNFSAPNPQIDFGASPFRVVDRLTPWPGELSPRRAAVSSFGLGGTNAHIVLEQPPAADRSAPSPRDHQLFLVSARTEGSLERATRALAEHLERRPELEPADVAHTLAVGRRHQRMRRAVVASDCPQAARALHAALGRPAGDAVGDRPTVFMFPGGGAQYAGMGQRLHATEPAFRRAFDRCADLSERTLGVSLRALVFGAGEPAALERPALALPALFATEYAMARLLESLAVRPSIMIGHSLGEYTAACLAGVMGLEDALALVSLRGRLFEELPPGAMISVQLPAADLERRLGDDLSIAVINKTDLCTVAGSDQAVADLERRLAQDGVETRRLRIAVAAHSHLVEPILARFGEFAATISFSEPQIPFVSNLTGRLVEAGEVTRPEYWVTHLRSTVRFVDGLATALGGRATVAVEVGPGQTLSGFARQQSARADGQVVVPTLPHPSEKIPDDAFFLGAVGKLWAAGVPVELAALHAGEQRLRVPLPTYPFERDRHWIERGTVPAARAFASASANGRAHDAEIAPREPEPVAAPAPRDRRSWIQERLLEEFSALSGMSAQELEPRASFLELGFDSLFMTQAASAISAAFGTKVSFRHLLEEAPTLDALTSWLDERLPEDQQPAPVAEPTGASAVPGLDELAVQLAAIQRQVTALAGGQPSAEPTVDGGAATPDVPAGPPPAEPTGPWRPLERRGDDLDPEQLRHLQALTQRLTSRTAGSKAATAANRGHLADPRTVAGFRRTWKEIVYPIVADRSAGSKLWDIDGNEFLDVAMGFGVNLFGHSPPFVIDAVTAQLARGIEIGPQTPLAGETAALLAEMTGHERVAFCNTGSEAVLAAMRLARTVTGRSKIVTFANDYHGLFDEVLARGVLRNGERRSLPIAPGIPAHAAQDLIIFDYGDPEALRYVTEHASELAAVLVEPVQSRFPEKRPVEFLRELRRSTAAGGVALVFDEMITGFRAHPGGAQAMFGIRADLATYGKVIGGGFPIGVVAGNARFMDALDGGAWRYGDDSIPEADVTWFAGTFVRHPVALAASRAVLEHLRAAGPGLQADLNARTTAFAAGLNEFLQELDVPIRIEHFSSLFLTRFARDQGFASLFYFHLRDQGIHITEGRGAFLSTAHSDADLERLDAAYRSAASAMKAVGFLSGAGAAPKPPKARELPVTEGQQEILLAASLSTAANCSYNLANTLHITGPMDVDALRRALARVVARHEALRVTFTADLTHQRIAHELPIELSVVDLSEGDHDPREAALAERRTAEVETPFDLQAGPLIRVALLRMAADEHHLFVTVHHAICDGWSSGTLLRHVVEAYTAERHGDAVDESPPMQLSEYVDWFDRYLRSAERGEDERFWAARVTPDFPTTELPADNPRAASKSYRAQRQELPLERELVAELRGLAAAQGKTLFAVLLASFECLLARLTRQSEVALGVSIGGHTQFPGRELVAHCVNLLPLRRAVAADLSFSEHLATTQTAILDAFEHQNLSYGAIVRASGIRRDPTRTPLVTVTFNMDTPSDALDMDGAVAVPGSSPRHFENFDLFLNIVPRGDELVVEATYNTGLFEAATVVRWLSHYETLLRNAAAQPDTPLAALPILDDVERRRILDEWNDTYDAFGDSLRLDELFEAQVARTPDADAVVGTDDRVSYEELERRANQLAHRLRAMGIGRDVLVGVCLERSVQLVVTLLAVLKAGGAYVPLDPEYPAARLAFMVEDSRLHLIVTQRSLAERLPADAPLLHLDEEANAVSREPTAKPSAGGSSSDLAYVIYTSGSTGQPNGVEMEHAAAANHMLWMCKHLPFEPFDRVLQRTPLSFDASVWEIFAPLVAGAVVVMAPPDASQAIGRLGEVIADNRVTILQLVPSFARVFLDDVDAATCASLRRVLCGGEPLPVSLYEDLCDRLDVEVVNLYGPTEACIDATWWPSEDINAEASSHPRKVIPIGRPISNCRAYVLDDAGEPVPIGTVGELYLAGAGLARGYRGRKELTAERFVTVAPGRGVEQRMYRTGDLARFAPDGTIEFLGRRDHQVKIRGFRIELGEIEAAIRSAGDIADVVVIDREDDLGERRLVAYVASRLPSAEVAARIRTELRRALPDYMVPASIVALPALPLAPNGKIDRRSLPAPGFGSSPTEGRAHVTPRTATEEQIALVWSDVLKVHSPGVDDDFFESGGHSLIAARIVARLRSSFGVDIAMRHLFEQPTIAGLAEIIDVLAVSAGDGDRQRDGTLREREEIEI